MPSAPARACWKLFHKHVQDNTYTLRVAVARVLWYRRTSSHSLFQSGSVVKEQLWQELLLTAAGTSVVEKRKRKRTPDREATTYQLSKRPRNPRLSYWGESNSGNQKVKRLIHIGQERAFTAKGSDLMARLLPLIGGIALKRGALHKKEGSLFKQTPSRPHGKV